ncbi:Membrane-bound lytic murein transglycosylase D OS=Castellaniella defragrans (strain DSM / CCUG 39792 / 65Phen) OX=1437824 GN=BN940_17571 PE=3 SV=1 [Castellaniella denitrificans]|uniref:transglycosylase SLT domain-containing protein n=1 Tax=Castellaniella sp. TaxID=1955812 RepID=UPI002AFF5013|nr:transglycosylase SLT domain-containing protein [Castellaniella sp.]
MKTLRLLLPLILVVLAGCATRHQTADQRQVYVAEDTSRTVDLTHPPRDMWDRIRRGFAIPNLRNERVDYWTDYYASHPQSVLLMSQRAGKYLYYIVDELNRRGLPTELALLPFVESAYNPNALSRSQASGLWQFIPSTGQHYKLEQDWWRDQRRDPVASTQAALDYLSYLYDFQGDWYLALASYNWGEGAVKRAMDKASDAGKPTGYTALDMPDETRNYVPKLQAIKNIIARPEKFGITLPNVSNAPYFTTVHKSRDMDVAVAAALAEMPLEDFQALNPSYNRPVILAAHNPALHLPLDKVGVFNENLESYTGRLSSWQVVHPQKGQSLASIAKAHGITLNQLRQANKLGSKQTRATVATLLIPAREAPAGGLMLASYQASATEPAAGHAPARQAGAPSRASARLNAPDLRPKPSVRTHTIRQGDTLYSLARRYNTSVDALRKLNNLKGSSLSAGQRLRVPGTDVQG